MNDFMRVDKTNFHANGKLQRPFKFKVDGNSRHSNKVLNRTILQIFFAKFDDDLILIAYDLNSNAKL